MNGAFKFLEHKFYKKYLSIMTLLAPPFPPHIFFKFNSYTNIGKTKQNKEKVLFLALQTLWNIMPEEKEVIFFCYLLKASYNTLAGKNIKPQLISTLLPGQGHFPLDQFAQSFIQPDLKHFQQRDGHSFSGQPLGNLLYFVISHFV